MKERYTTKDISRTLSVSERTARRYVEKLINTEKGTLYIEEDVYNFIINKYSADNLRTDDGQPADTDGVTEFFTSDEYIEFQKRLTEYPVLNKHIETLQLEIEYHKNQYNELMKLHSELIQMHKITMNTMVQRNYIEAKEKGLDR